MKNLIIDFPDCCIDELTPYLIQEKLFEFVEVRPEKYAKEFNIMYREDKVSSVYIKKLIEDWDLHSTGFKPKGNENWDKVKCIKEMVNDSDEALIFHHYDKRVRDMGNKIMLDHCVDNDLYTRICRLDFGRILY